MVKSYKNQKEQSLQSFNFLNWKEFLAFSIFVEKEDHLSVLATRHDACSRPWWWGSCQETMISWSCTNDTQWWWMQWLLGKVEGPRSKESTKRKTTRNIWPFYKLSSSFQTPSGSLQDWFEALTKDSPGSHSLWWIFKTSVFPENLEKECCESFKFWTTLWKLLTNITFMFYVPSGKGVIDSGQGPLQAVLGGQLFLQRTWACRSWPNSWFNEMGLEISLRRIIINT